MLLKSVKEPEYEVSATKIYVSMHTCQQQFYSFNGAFGKEPNTLHPEKLASKKFGYLACDR